MCLCGRVGSRASGIYHFIWGFKHGISYTCIYFHSLGFCSGVIWRVRDFGALMYSKPPYPLALQVPHPTLLPTKTTFSLGLDALIHFCQPKKTWPCFSQILSKCPVLKNCCTKFTGQIIPYVSFQIYSIPYFIRDCSSKAPWFWTLWASLLAPYYYI